jgi:hypothetical protein
MWDNNQKEAWIDVNHMIIPNPEWNPKMADAKYKRYKSSYFEIGSSGNLGSQHPNVGGYFTGSDQYKILRDSGYDYFPVICPRWEVTVEDTYGTDCPGMTALGDIKQLQLGEKRALQAIEKSINPPMIGPLSMKNTKASIIAGDITYVDEREGQKGFRQAHDINFNLVALENKQEQVRTRIRKAFFEDLFLMLATSDRRDFTAREIEERHEEKLLAIGPVLEQVNQDGLDPLIDITFNMMAAQNLLPPPPPELEGKDLKVEYVSIMSQAQKLIGIAGVERFTTYVGQLAAANPDVLDKVNMDKAVDAYADMTGIPVDIVRTKEEVVKMRDARAEAQAQATQQQQMMNMAQVAKDAGSVPVGEGNQNLASKLLGV